ncbi:MAG: helix-turn-helix transcriptional regulator [Coprococcus sp.]|nr:helix-turn-helix transcriptional regulator [Coprococcus sp.]
MQLGEVIRKYRKDKNMTQEEMAGRLGVTAPAVNKWENGNSFPDITLLAPIARLLGISLDTLLSFREELTEKEIAQIVREVDRRLREETYDEVFRQVKKTLAKYPNSEQLAWQMAVILDAQRGIQGISDTEEYESYIYSLYLRVLKSNDETMRGRAADSLFAFHMRKKEYEKAQEALTYLSEQNPERKRKQAQLYTEMGRIQEAYKAYEELLFANYQIIDMTISGMYMLAVKEQDLEKAHMLADKQSMMARCFDMGRYYESTNKFDLAVLEKDATTVLTLMEEMLSGIGQIGSWTRSPLYEHMGFKEVDPNFLEKMEENLRNCFRDEEKFDFLKDDERWRKLAGC